MMRVLGPGNGIARSASIIIAAGKHFERRRIETGRGLETGSARGLGRGRSVLGQFLAVGGAAPHVMLI